MHRPPKQDRMSRYTRHIMRQPCKWLAIMDLAIRHYPKNLRNYACEQMMLAVTCAEYGVKLEGR